MIIKFWDGTEKRADTRKEAVHIAEEGLEGWRQEGDRVVWTSDPLSGKLPAQAIVITEYCEETDACAAITEANE